MTEPTDEELALTQRILEAVAADRGLLARLPEDARRAFIVAAGRVARPDRREMRDLVQAQRQRERAARRAAEEQTLDRAGVRALRREALFPTPALEPGDTETASETPPELERPRCCYVCKAAYRHVHHFYDQLCPACADLNYQKRFQTANLTGRVALITGARVKIGYHAAIKLLRAGAHVIVTTRFPRDAAQRYAAEPDFESFRDRLEIVGLDLVHTPSVERFAEHLDATLERLDFVLHNACQTVRKPPGFYAHLLDSESAPLSSLPAHAHSLLRRFESLRAAALPARTGPDSSAPALALAAPTLFTQLTHGFDEAPDVRALFPEGARDQDAQQIDLRAHNSWRMRLAEVPTVELVEVLLVNATAPFVLNARLKPLLLRHRTRDKHIVNVSAMEGKFVGHHKTDKHPHTNMAKAALNMMTRTSAAEYARDGIHMNSVDTGWITDEDPAALAERKRAFHRFHPPLDVVDGAARIVDPIFDGLRTGTHVFGKFLKDYRETEW